MLTCDAMPWLLRIIAGILATHCLSLSSSSGNGSGCGCAARIMYASLSSVNAAPTSCHNLLRIMLTFSAHTLATLLASLRSSFWHLFVYQQQQQH